MASSSQTTDEQSLKLAVAISLLRSKLFHKQPPSPPPSPSDALRWKRKAKERKQEIIRLREDLKEAEDASHCDLYPQNASCKCYFFDNLGKLCPMEVTDSRFNDVLRRRFLRQVRLKERRKRTTNLNQRSCFSDLCGQNEVEQLGAAVDFLVELCDNNLPVDEANFKNWSHQAADFILASLRNLSSIGNSMDLIEGIISSLIARLVRRMCSPSQGDVSHHVDTGSRFYIQHLIRKLGSEPYVGQRAILSVSQRISMVAENLLFLDPFDEAFPNMHECLFIMIQLVEFLVSDYLLTWSGDKSFDNVLFEQWVASVLHVRKALELLESRNGLYVLYIDQVVGELSKQVGQVPSFQKLNQSLLDNLFN